ncbi:F-BAR domain only protein 2-like isoform X2 [Babylonia areolata]|uniref:F-BAR domain only protein 2-like isoform X2 n=1 Tax=Babylonia areolata TaxID=304850 RepID=UPI003FD1A7C0
MSTFADNFWGEKNNGFFVLYHNMKYGQTSIKELGDCLREVLAVEESHSKLLNKLTKNIANASHVGTFSPFWQVWKAFMEKLSSLHMQMMHTCSDLLKDLARYSEEQHKKHKTMKENEQPTLEAVQNIQTTLTLLHKAKEIYHTRCIEKERLKRENASAKDIEKAKQKYKKAYDEYKGLVDKYQTVKTTFEKKMTESCRHFQELEEEHICQMKDFVDTYIKAWENQHVLLGQIQHEFKTNCDELTVQKLINTFIEAKSTGTQKPGPIEFVEPDLTSLPSPAARPMSPELVATDSKRDSFTEKQKQDSSGSPSPVLSDQPGPLSRSVKLRVSRTWFLKNKNKKKEKEKKGKKKKDKDGESLDAESQGEGPEAPQVDGDGYCIRPDNPMDNNGDKNSWYSSDSDSDSDGEEGRRKIIVAIRPLSPTNAAPAASNVEDIRASVQGLSLSPTAARKRSQTPVDKKMKRSQSESDTLDKPSQDLLNLDLFNSSSSASTPTGASYNLPSPLSIHTEINWGLTSAPPLAAPPTSQPVSSPSNNLTDLFSTPNDSSNSGLSGSNPTPTITPTPTSSPPSTLVTSPTTPAVAGITALPAPVTARPPSRNRGVIPPAIPQSVKSQNGPVSLSRSDSGSTFSTTSTSMPIGSSRGPSPLTIGMSDTIPLAVAFTDTVSAFFKGTDATRCTVRVTGVLHMSFPIGIIRVFTDNPNPPALTFRLKNTSKLQAVDHCDLISKDPSQSTAQDAVYTFDMAGLKEHLRRQGEQNKTAYFNVEILRYQVKVKTGVESTPLPLVVYCKSEESSSEWRLDYRYNAAAMSSPTTIKNVSVAVSMPPEAQVTKMQSIPIPGNWDAETKRATWKLNDISEVSEQETQGFIRAKFDVKNGPIKPLTTMLQFGAEGANLSGSDFELVGSGYRISLTKKRFCTGKYYADPEPSVSEV